MSSAVSEICDEDRLQISRSKHTLVLDKDLDFGKAIQVLQDKDCVVLYVYLYRSFVRRFSLEKVAGLFYYARLPNLLGLKMERRRSDDDDNNDEADAAGNDRLCTFPVRAFCSVLRHCTKLEYLICNLHLSGKRNDFDGLGKVIQNLVKLQCVGLTLTLDATDDIPIANNNDQDEQVDGDTNVKNSNLLDSLIQGLSKLPSLTDVIIKGDISNPVGASLGTLASSSLADLCRAPRLSSLYLFLFVLSDTNVACMAQALEENRSLKELCINCCTLGSLGSKALSKMIAKNNTIKELIMIVTSYDTRRSSVDEVDTEIAKGVASSTSLTEFLFHGGPGEIGQASLMSFRNAMYHNYKLQKMSLRIGESAANKRFEEEIQFYLALNKAGRSKLLTEGDVLPSSQWIDMLEHGSPNLSHFYYFLRACPSICIVPSGAHLPLLGHQNNNNNPRKRKRLYRAAKYNGTSYR